jgi:U3 small nucleolar RNA-associated protein MPP10
MENVIEETEKKMMSDKQWHMRGEITAKQRPKGSLLENFLDFDVSVKPPPIPTKDYTDNIEKVIKLRVKEDLFDDPVRSLAINLNNKGNNYSNELKFDKDKKGLAEVYEDEYKENVMKITDTDGNAAKKEIDELCSKIYTIFDKLTNNNFVSGNRNTEMKVITNVPSIKLEEISNYVTDNKASSQSANELFNKKDIDTKSKNEMTKEEKKTSHQHWKRNIRNRLREKIKNTKLNSLAKTVNSKFEAKMIMKGEKDKKSKKNIKSKELKSSKFFANLQNVVGEDLDKKNKKEENKNVKVFKL